MKVGDHCVGSVNNILSGSMIGVIMGWGRVLSDVIGVPIMLFYTNAEAIEG